MPKSKQSKTQVKRAKRALERLRDAGLYTGKFDKRRKVSRSQEKIIRKFSDYLKGQAAIVKPKDAGAYRGMYRVVGNKVIVPKKPGEKIKIGKRGGIIKERKSRSGRKITSEHIRIKKSEIPPPENARQMYAVPFIRGRNADGTPILHWQRFTYNALQFALAHYGTKDQETGKARYRDIRKFVVLENVGEHDDARATRIMKRRGLIPHFAGERARRKRRL